PGFATRRPPPTVAAPDRAVPRRTTTQARAKATPSDAAARPLVEAGSKREHPIIARGLGHGGHAKSVISQLNRLQAVATSRRLPGRGRKPRSELLARSRASQCKMQRAQRRLVHRISQATMEFAARPKPRLLSRERRQQRMGGSNMIAIDQ